MDHALPDDGFRTGGAFLGVEYENQPIEPYKQGSLDKFCGLYALINAVHLASGGVIMSEQSPDHLFETLTTMAMETETSGKYRFRGLDGPDLEKLAKTLLYGLNINDYRLGLVDPYTKLLRDGERSLSKRKLIRRALKTDRVALIVHIDNAIMSHWTVARSIDNDRVTLFDSNGLQSVPLKQVTPWRIITDRSKHF